MIDASDARAGLFDGPEEMLLGSAYPQFLTKELALRTCAVRRIGISATRGQILSAPVIERELGRVP